jgi:Zn-dependent protease
VHGFDLAQRLQSLIVLLLSLTVHEFFHAWTAWRLGDDTAARMGRLTLNPIAHMDPIGTLLLPLLGVPFGWAKPVPVNPANFRRGVRMSTGDILVSVAGPLSNLGLALLAAVVKGLLIRFGPQAIPVGGVADVLLDSLVLMNIGLAVFNILPFPPLDGSHVVGSLVPARWRDGWNAFLRVGPVLLMLLLVFPSVGGFSPLGRILGPPSSFLVGVVNKIIGGIAP